MSKSKVIASLVFVALLLFVALPGPISSASAPPTPVPQQSASCGLCYQAAPTKNLAPPAMPASAASTSYDEQIGMTFTQSFTSMAYNVTAVQQSDPVSGSGPAYLLNGLSDAGYWYQVGLAWNWDPGNSPGTGFDLVYEVFQPNGSSIFPVNGGGGLQAFSGQVNAGDKVLLNLYFSSTLGVVMFGKDWNTGATSSQTYSAEGAGQFVGLGLGPSNAEGFFTGLMTEWYHSSAYYSNVAPVTYSNPRFALSSAWMWIDEFSCSDVSCANRSDLFVGQTPAPVAYTTANKLHEFSSNGATEFSDAHQLVTGPAYLALTVSYSVEGGGSGYGQPAFTYTYQGSQSTSAISQSPEIFIVDAGSTWSVTGNLQGSFQGERWALWNLGNEGVADSNSTIVLAYQHQYLLSVTGGGVSTNGEGWYLSGSTATVTTPGTFGRSGGSGERIVSYAVDGTSTYVSPSSGTVSLSVLMDGPHTVAFEGVQQFRLTLEGASNASLFSITSPTIPGDQGWYDTGTAVTAKYDAVWGVVPGMSRVVATGYSVDSGTIVPIPSPGAGEFMVNVSMVSPRSISIGSELQYNTTFSFRDASGNRSIAPSDVHLTAGNETFALIGNSAWLVSGTTFTVSSLTFEGVDVNPHAQTQYHVAGPSLITIDALVYDANLKVTDLLKLPVAGAQVTMTLANGTMVSGKTNGSGIYTAKDIPLGTFTATVASIISTTRLTGDASVQGVVPVSVAFGASSLVGLAIVLAAMIASLAVFVLRRTRKGAASLKM